ncbi:MAG: hypothetical protein JWO98_2185 [Frankiales bacterium]|nr:hypothetical protein [Frankiales bacterium]
MPHQTITERTDTSASLYGGSLTPRIAIIGAGMGGVAQAVKLVQAGIPTFTIFEKSPGAGGTWYDNRYPGAQCDVPSMLYSFDFHLINWPKTHATQPELQQYIDEIIDLFSFRDRIRFGLGVERAVWNEDAQGYAVTTTDGETHDFDVVISAVGMLNVPNEVSWPGVDAFQGEIFHSSRWKEDFDPAGKRVAVVGAGASAAQIVPNISDSVGHLLSFQREPNWVSPKGDHTLTAEEFEALSTVRARKKLRRQFLDGADSQLAVGNDVDGPDALAARARVTGYITSTLEGRPDLLAHLVPEFPLRCKRPVASDIFLQAFLKPNVELVPHSVRSLTTDGIVDDDGTEYKVDAIVLATGFQSTNYLATLEVTGRNGIGLHDFWEGDPKAFLGMTVPGFPNFFLLYGPNTHGTVVSFAIERQAESIAKDVKRLSDHKATAIEVRREVFDRFQIELQSGIREVEAWDGNCHNYYVSESGTNVTQWPWSHKRYAHDVRTKRKSASSLSYGPERESVSAGVPVLGEVI